MRCPDCGKFVPYDTEVEPEENQEPEVRDDGELTASYDRILNCEECGTELKRATIEFSAEVVPERDRLCDNADHEAHDWDVSGLSAEPSTGAQTTDRKGKPITNPRYITTLYGVELGGTIKCSQCGLTIEVALSESVAASAMDEST
jgi:DNA-directed RNA polymerase subunit RPC12/RpoP